ncbi:hypothetical protein ACIGO9_30095 [Nocardia asteroides]|uniref:hypothetical protein n=1 Tax=Nocardia asteroides TaxID=1824 RepID=UPI0037C71E5C
MMLLPGYPRGGGALGNHVAAVNAVIEAYRQYQDEVRTIAAADPALSQIMLAGPGHPAFDWWKAMKSFVLSDPMLSESQRAVALVALDNADVGASVTLVAAPSRLDRVRAQIRSAFATGQQWSPHQEGGWVVSPHAYVYKHATRGAQIEPVPTAFEPTVAAENAPVDLAASAEAGIARSAEAVVTGAREVAPENHSDRARAAQASMEEFAKFLVALRDNGLRTPDGQIVSAQQIDERRQAVVGAIKEGIDDPHRSAALQVLTHELADHFQSGRTATLAIEAVNDEASLLNAIAAASAVKSAGVWAATAMVETFGPGHTQGAENTPPPPSVDPGTAAGL